MPVVQKGSKICVLALANISASTSSFLAWTTSGCAQKPDSMHQAVAHAAQWAKRLNQISHLSPSVIAHEAARSSCIAYI